MSRDYKNSGSAAPNGRGNPMGVGILIGLLLGLCIALGVALYINKGANPFVKKPRPAESVGRETPPAETTQTPPSTDKPAKTAEVKPRFDFYKILPGTEEAVTDKEFKRVPPASNKEVYFLQVAAFQNPSDADNLKARLALSGIEAQIQTATLPDGRIWHRVRVGPFSNKDELGKSRAALKENNLEANLIKVREPTQ
ncbi:MAG TPA: SPOR domain-containing protein [Burkholderiales bacterium]|jgi:cell division protein FtsN|nr:SPOR domain-containing protein [Burkholderiales bacterium]